MADDWLTGGMRGLVAEAVAEAAARGTSTVEAEHVLLAIAAGAGSPTAGILAAAGLDHAGLTAALDAERAKSLEVLGVATGPGLLRSAPRTAKPALGASVAAARARAGSAPGRTRRAAEPQLAAGILSAGIGTVPRALAYAGIDRQALLQRLAAQAGS